MSSPASPFEHFTLHTIQDGVYAAISNAGSAAYSNAGIVDLGDQTLVFDTLQTPKAAADLRRAAEQLTGRPATQVLISHAHSDHWMGNQVFADDATITSTTATRQEMLLFSETIRGYQADPTGLQEKIRSENERLDGETDRRRRAAIKASIARWTHILEMLPNLQLHFPTRTFDGRLEFQGSRRRAELITLGKGHSDGDCFLLLAEDKTIFMGDLGFFRCHPFMGNCDPTAWIEQLEIMEQMDIQTFIPGHGPLGTKADIALQKRYIKVLEEMVVSVVTTGGSLDDALKQSFPESLESWLSSGTTRFESNVRFLFERLAEEHRE